MESQKQIPRHVAVIMDGNGRWAKKRHLPRNAGHKAGVEAVRKLIEICLGKGIDVLTLFAFSTENWRRPRQEINALMELFLLSLQREAKKLHENNVKLRFIGDISSFNSRLKEKIASVENLTEANNGLVLVIAVNYGGQWDILEAARKLAHKVAAGELQADDIGHENFAQELCLADLPEPDLFIRTSGEQRISNFLNWQLAYTELYFTDTLWPDFNAETFAKALAFFANRQRRFGCINEQIKQKEYA